MTRKFIFGAVVVLAAATCVVTSAFSPRKARLDRDSFTGEQLFRGVYFEEGQVGAIIRTNTNAANQTNLPHVSLAAKERINALVAKVKTSDPQYFQKFKEVIDGGNPLAIETGLIKGQNKINRILTGADESTGTKTLPNAGIAVEMLPVYTSIVVPPPPVLANPVYYIWSSSEKNAPLVRKIEPNSLQAESLSYSIAQQFGGTK